MTQGSHSRSRREGSYDVAIVGAGPAGCVTALAFAERGARVLLLEANPQSSRRLAGEWIHPPAVDILKRFGVEPRPVAPFHGGRGFVVFPDDGSRPVVLPYASGTFAYSFEHSSLVDTLREHCDASRLIDYMPYARATELADRRITYQVESGGSHVASADLLVGASGRMSVAHTALGIRRSAGTYSRMAGLVLKNVEMPFEGYGHVCLGGLGPILAYRIDAQHVRVQLDVPLSLRLRRDRQAVLYEAYAPALPEQVRPAFREALLSGNLMWATNQIRPRVEFGREGLALVGDAVGYHHPLTAVGMTMGFQDAVALANAKSFSAYRRERILRSRVPEMLAVALYEIFADTSDEVVEIRRAIYDLWRSDSLERFQTMRFLGCQDTNPLAFGTSFYKAVLLAGKSLVRGGMSTGRWDHVRDVSADLADRSRWLLAGALHLRAATPVALSQKNVPGEVEAAQQQQSGSAEERYGAALRASSSKADVVELPVDSVRAGIRSTSPAIALERAVRALVALQDADGSWEGEVVASPALAAEYVIASHLMGSVIAVDRRRRLALYFERSRAAGSARLWGHAPGSSPDAAVTTLVYLALRILDVAHDDVSLKDAATFVRDAGGLGALRSFSPRSDRAPHTAVWLAMLGLVEWDEVTPVVPELWSMPSWLPTHPSHYDLFRRHLYLGLAGLFGTRFTAPESTLTTSLKNELGARNGGSVGGHKKTAVVALFERAFLGKGASEPGIESQAEKRVAALASIRETIRDELRSTGYAGLSPSTTLLHALALHADKAGDPDAVRALDHVVAFMWEDEVDGARLAAARSSVLDTSLALFALSEASPLVDVRRAVERADAFLEQQSSSGGFSAAGAWHPFTSNDATASALFARIAIRPSILADLPRSEVTRAVQLVLQAQNPDGGFADHTPRRPSLVADWLVPSAVRDRSPLQTSSVEITSSSILALQRARPLLDDGSVVDEPVRRAVARLRESQLPNGAWAGVRGVRLVFGTLFGIRGLMAGGVRATDPQIRKACTFIKSQQRADGSWGETPVAGSNPAVYDAASEGHVTQTAWALMALLEAEDADWDSVDRAAHWLSAAQLGSGEWPRETPCGFVGGELCEPSLYRTSFPLSALAHYETRRKRRSSLYVVPAGAEPTAAE